MLKLPGGKFFGTVVWNISGSMCLHKGLGMGQMKILAYRVVRFERKVFLFFFFYRE